MYDIRVAEFKNEKHKKGVTEGVIKEAKNIKGGRMQLLHHSQIKII